MTRILRFALALASLVILPGCGTVSDLVVTNIPDNHRGKTKIVVDLRNQRAYLYKGKTAVAESRISTGREGHDTPEGRFTVTRKDQDHRSSVYGDYADRANCVVVANVDVRKTQKPSHAHFVGAPMPYFIEFSPGFGLHAGDLPGYPASHGCVRLTFWKARQFYNAAKVGTPILIKQG